MPLDFFAVKQQIDTQAAEVPAQLAQLGELQACAKELLVDYADEAEKVQAKIDWAVGVDKNIRCALPAGEALNALHACPDAPPAATVIAADGSQIYPSNHESVNYSVVNLGAIQFEMGQETAPRIHSSVTFQLLEFVQSRQSSVEAINLERDKLERVFLAQIATEAEGSPVITLTDGPLELWGAKVVEFTEGAYFSEALEDYLASLRILHKLGAATAGYVAKPRAGLVTRTLEIMETPRDQPEQLKSKRSLQGVSDLFLFGQLLAPGERSAVFGLQSAQKDNYAGELALHFFYLNLGTEGQPSIARVEVPAWVVADATLLNGVHATLFEQSRFFGTVTFPYVLHRAHEEAAISFDMREQITQMLADKLLSLGLRLDTKSAKQLAKDL
jgi:hypothetical protein